MLLGSSTIQPGSIAFSAMVIKDVFKSRYTWRVLLQLANGSMSNDASAAAFIRIINLLSR